MYDFYQQRKRKYINNHKFINNLKNKFYSKVLIPEKEDDCMLWIGAGKNNVNGHMRINRSNIPAYRISYQIFNGIVPDNLEVMHKCDNPMCVRPDHLSLGTHKDNMNDRRIKNRDPMKKNEVYKHQYQKITGKAPHVKLTSNQVTEIKSLIKEKVPHLKIAKLFKVDASTISNIKTEKTWSHIA